VNDPKPVTFTLVECLPYTREILPSDCPGCLDASPYPSIYSYLSAKYPDSRMAFLSHDEDVVISSGYLMNGSGFLAAMKDFTVNDLGPLPDWRSFVAAGNAHTFLYNISAATTENQDTITLADWLTQMYSDDPSWQSATSIMQ
jgi:hypothetical protein